MQKINGKYFKKGLTLLRYGAIILVNYERKELSKMFNITIISIIRTRSAAPIVFLRVK